MERFEVTFTGISAELFREERADLCRADGIYDICLLIQDKLFPYGADMARYRCFQRC